MKEYKVTMDDFDIIKVLGRGTYGKVMLVEKRDTKKTYAMKSLRKKFIIDENQLEHTITERKILEKVKHPFLVGLSYVHTTIPIFFTPRGIPNPSQAFPGDGVQKRRRAVLAPAKNETIPRGAGPVLCNLNRPCTWASARTQHRLQRSKA